MGKNKENKNDGRSESLWMFVLTVRYYLVSTLTQKLDQLYSYEIDLRNTSCMSLCAQCNLLSLCISVALQECTEPAYCS